MKKLFFTLLAVATVALFANATDLTGKRIYINPGHGSFGPNDRPMATIPYPKLSSTDMPDTCGFYESNTDLWKCLYLGQKLEAAGATVMYSRVANGPWPYEKVDGQYPSYSYDDYKSRPDYEQYNRNLSEICEEVESNNIDYFISVHSNAATDGTTTNYPLGLYRGYDNATTAHDVQSKAAFEATWPWRWEMFGAGFDHASYYSATNMNVRGDINFYGSSSTRTSAYSGQSYTGYLGVLKHGAIGGLWEGFFHTYQPARHRALNHDYCHMEGLGYFRGILDYYNADPETVGYICGTVKDMDAKMVHPLFKYAAKTNDQWVPCNGATVYLLSATGDTLQSYQVDSLYNGIFAFYDLAPGTYHLAAECAGYSNLDAEQMAADVVVTANHTTYPFIQLRDTGWTPPAVVYETYPDKSTATGLNGKYNFGAAQTASFASVVGGKTVKQVLVRDDNEAYVLATSGTDSYIYKINTLTGALIQEVSTAGTQGQYNKVSRIAFTADSVLVGCNYEECQFTPVGTFRTYYWNMADLTAAPTAWFTSRWAGNFNNANVGETFAVSGALKAANVFTDAQTTGSSHQFRIAMMSTDNGSLVSTTRNQNANEFTQPLFGNYTAQASPNSDERALFIGENRTIEFSFNADAQAPTIHFDMPGAKGGECFKFGGKAVIAAPVVAAGAVTGVRMYNFSKERAAYGTSYTNIAMNVETNYYSVKPLAAGEDIILYVATDSAIYRYSTAGQEQPQSANVYAYGLTMAHADGNYTFNYTLNVDAEEGALLFTAADGSQLASVALTDLSKGAHSIVVAEANMPAGQNISWAIRVAGAEVGSWSLIEKKTSAELNTVRVFNAVNVYPETEHFGEIYLMDRKGANDAASGLLVMNPDYTLQYTTPAKGSQSYYGSPYRMGIASDGYVFVGDWADPHSGVYVVDPSAPQTSHSNFFAGTQNSAGLWKNAAGVEEGSSTPSVYVYGTGADTKLLVYNEDPGTSLPTNGLCVYNIGQEDGSIAHSWDGAPSAKMNFAGQANTNGNVWGCSKGVWVSQHRSTGNNNASATSLRFYDWDGNCTYSSHEAPVDEYEQLVIQGSLGSCFALTADESRLILRNDDKHFSVFNVSWAGNTPTLTLDYNFNNGITGDFDLLQMNWDYAGNLVVSGGAGVYVYAVPQPNNIHTTPAQSAYIINGVAAEGISLDVTTLDMQVGETETLTATVSPAEASNKKVIWTTSDATVATVSGGQVKAVANGQATITATSAEGGFTATCVVTVTTPVQGIRLNATSASVKVGETYQFSAYITPVTASNQNAVWSSDSEANATVDITGLVTGVAEGFATITVASEEDPSITASALLTIEVADDIEYVAVDGIFYAEDVIYNRKGLNMLIFNAAGQLVGNTSSDFSMAGMPHGTYVIATSTLNLKIVR